MNTFSALAKYYDLLYHDKNYVAEVDFIDGLLREQKAGYSLLEMGCGTAAHAVHLLNRGYTVTGFDLSPQMLDLAEQRRAALAPDFAKRLTLAQGDACSFDAGHSFDAVSSLFHVMSYQTTDEAVRAMMATARRHLEVGAPFIFDFWFGPAIHDEGPARREKIIDTPEAHIHRLTEPTWLRDHHLVHIDYTFTVTDKTSGVVSVEKEHHEMRYFFADEMKAFLESAGFSLHTMREWMTGATPSAKTFGVYAVAIAR